MKAGKAEVFADLGTTPNYDIATDGSHAAVILPDEAESEQQSQNHVIFLMNFSDELKRKVPIK
jgi:hypothetical protein